MDKNFNEWNLLKQKLDQHQRVPTFNEREIWWCSIGLNVGHEENGKGKDYSRPVSIVRKFNRHLFFGVPLTTQIKEKHYYHKITFKDKEQCIMLSQSRPLEAKRLINKEGQISKNQFEEIRKKLKGMI